jgi:imidazole glycerol-phosphate synthase subunit HisF
MLIPRIIPVLLLKNNGLVKTVRFREPTYVGDPINAIRIFNDKAVDEIVFLDISASIENRDPHFDTISEVASECFMPFAYGGGIRDLKTVEKILRLGAEKVVINSQAAIDTGLLREAARCFGSQSIVGSMDVKRSVLGKHEVFVRSGTINARQNPEDYIRRLEDAGVGEVFVNSIDRDGTLRGYDCALIRQVTNAVRVPVVAIGGAGSVADMVEVIRGAGASGAGAGSIFVFHGKFRAVLITYPDRLAVERELR